MILNLEKLIKKYNLKIRGVIHIGAHTGGEAPIYEKLGIKNTIYYEPVPASFKKLKKKVGRRAVNLALGNFNGTAKMYIASNRGMSSSLLKPNIHLTQYPGITYDKYNMINIDTEGYELEVFRGGIETLKKIDYIMTEVSRAELYERSVQIYELDVFLSHFGFVRKEVDWAGGTWGDAFYMK
jgi:FkbM family methyltransferase